MVTLRPLSPETPAVRKAVSLVLLQAAPQGAKLDLIVRQATECGVSEIVPFIAERSVKRAVNLERLERIVREARQQSNSPVATVVRPVTTLAGALEVWENTRAERSLAVGAVFHTTPYTPIIEAMSDTTTSHRTALHTILDRNADAVVVAIGPEGGFTTEEVRMFCAAGFSVASLGETVLRVETAAVAALAVCGALIGERETWTRRSVNA
jgi:16S rRNA (uracil1498-N3)-methyltransferase